MKRIVFILQRGYSYHLKQKSSNVLFGHLNELIANVLQKHFLVFLMIWFIYKLITVDRDRLFL